MSSTAKRLPLAEARVLAEELQELLRPACERIEIAGSIRRQKRDIGDVEIVAIPRVDAMAGAPDLWGGPVTMYEVNRLDDLCAALLLRGVLEHRLDTNGRKAWGKDMKRGIYRGFAVDIFSANPLTWGVTMAIRTGPAKFSERLVTRRSEGGFCPGHLTFKGNKDDGSWRVRHRHTGEALDTPEERDVFQALGIEWLEPEQRTDTVWPRRLAEVAVNG